MNLRLTMAFTFLLLSARVTTAQGAAPETAPPLFPGGGLISYNSIFITRAGMQTTTSARPSLLHEGDFNFTWGFYKDFDLAVIVPVVTTRLRSPGASGVGGTGPGDMLVLAKYRFYRRDSPRGTTQASITLGPKFPTGSTGLTDGNGIRLPVGLQPGSGSTDLFVGANWTYTGLFNVRRLVADEDFHSHLRSQGSERTHLGNDFESRFWLSYRPYEAKNGEHEWFIGPDFTWAHSQNDSIARVTQRGSGGDALLAGLTTYVGVLPGMHLWLGMDWDVGHSTGALYSPLRRHISFGITRQFRLHSLGRSH